MNLLEHNKLCNFLLNENCKCLRKKEPISTSSCTTLSTQRIRKQSLKSDIQERDPISRHPEISAP